MFVSTTDSYVEVLAPKVMVRGGGVWGRCVGHEGGALRNGIRAFMRESPTELLSPFCHVKTQQEVCHQEGSTHLTLLAP